MTARVQYLGRRREGGYLNPNSLPTIDRSLRQVWTEIQGVVCLLGHFETLKTKILFPSWFINNINHVT